MKKPCNEYRKLLAVRQLRRRKRECKRANIERKKGYRNKRLRGFDTRLLNSGSGIRVHRNRQILAPESFDIVGVENRDEMLSFLSKITRDLRNGLTVKVDFEKTTKLCPAGTLLFVSKLESLLIKYPGKVGCSYPKDNIVEQLFQHIGLLSRLGLSQRVSITAENVKDWHYVCATNTDTSGFKDLFMAHSSDMDDLTRSGLYDSMTEAVTNTINHAYEAIGDCEPAWQRGWWMFSQHKDDMLSVAIADLGVGIPTSLSQKPEIKERVLGFIQKYKKRKDTYLIETAVHSERTRTKLPHRGKGLPDMLEFVRLGHVGLFRIFSRHGSFLYDARSKSESGHDYKNPIPGTLIQWEIPLRNGPNYERKENFDSH